MPGHAASLLDPQCVSTGQVLSVGTVALLAFTETDERYLADPATSVLAIDVIALPGAEAQVFHFVTLVLQIDAPEAVRLVAHSGRNNYHRERLADPDAAWFPDPDAVYWVEDESPSTTLRIRDDETDLWSGPGNGRTYYVGIAGLDDGAALRFTAFASASEGRVTTCALTIDDLHAGESVAGPIQP